ncbi:single-stranded DNA-binding protein [Geoalkalibacter halelectricus]|uniref:single-stranded DNA-binding protein n=1 Tax=Geoalkalibacter halelectricus TaxID=2847045 RepID=UPI003D2560C7
MARLKSLNEVELVGYLKPKDIVLPSGKELILGALSTSLREQNNAGEWETKIEEWHTLVPKTTKAADSIRFFTPPVPVARVKGRFRRRRYEKNGAVRYANEILVFDPITPSGTTARVNRITLRGNLGKDPSVIFPKDPEIDPVEIRLLLAIDRHYRLGEKWDKETTWLEVLFLTEIVLPKVRGLKKGDRIKVEGTLTYFKKDEQQFVEILGLKLLTPEEDQAAEMEKEEQELNDSWASESSYSAATTF